MSVLRTAQDVPSSYRYPYFDETTNGPGRARAVPFLVRRLFRSRVPGRVPMSRKRTAGPDAGELAVGCEPRVVVSAPGRPNSQERGDARRGPSEERARVGVVVPVGAAVAQHHHLALDRQEATHTSHCLDRQDLEPNRGERFSRNAVIPSRPSAEPNSRNASFRSTARPSSKLRSRAASVARIVER